MFHNVTYYALQFCKRLALSQFEAKIVIAEAQGVRWRARAGGCMSRAPSAQACPRTGHEPALL